MSFYLPTSPGEWLAAASALVTLVIGLATLVAPGPVLRATGMRVDCAMPATLMAGRARMAGFPIGIGFAALAFAQPFLFLALGTCWSASAIGRLVSLAADGGFKVRALALLACDVVLAALPLAYVFGVT
ncbi:AGROH133_08824 family phage infection protein [Pararhizobium mangrovi]|uniref:DUF4345 domain-containing protein n=1 Tax=Pararhizobium mangrovi TaxID=2590452 RepID=A0A506U0M7_9HYPH|nr:DUF4345 domain-containing protein [Pararhizobium mangrovi]TPW26515.1 DUF4345 domain-containing protein [Pararhizobium mangrovi]